MKKIWKFRKSYGILWIQILCKSFSLCGAGRGEGEAVAMDFLERRIDSEEKYKGVIVRVRLDHAELCDGRIVRREVVEHPGGVCILPVDGEGNCTMVRQFRYPFGRMMLEAPAGKLEYGEDPLDCAVRELSEETGYTADELIDLGAMCTSPGFSTEVLHMYLALGLHPGKTHPDEGEFLNQEKIPLKTLVDMVMQGEIDDGKTIAVVLKAEKTLQNR